MKLIHLARRALCITAAVLLAFSSVIGATANIYGKDTPTGIGRELELLTERIVYNDPSQYGYSDYIIVDENGDEVSERPAYYYSSELDEDVKNGIYDEKYDAREQEIITNPKQQGTSGSCWAFSAISCMETSMSKQGLNDEADDFSEAHLVYFTYNGLTSDEDSSVYGDGIQIDKPFDQGGNWLKSVATFSRGSGAELEQYAPFNANNPDSMAFPEEIRNESYARLKNAIKLDGNDRNSIKQAVLDYGSVSFAYYSDFSYYNTVDGQTGYYCGAASDITANHGATIIGWDDNYSKDNFKESKRPDNDGAWLVKNSWGENWGDNGYFWMSYEEPSMKTFVAFQAQAISDFDNIYQYDGAGYNVLLGINGYNTISMANIFTADSNETLEAVSFYTVQNNQDYNIKIYTDCKEVPDDGKLVSEMNGNFKNQGYHTVDLDNTTELKEDQRFSVVVTVTAKSDPVAKIAAEGPSSGIYNFSAKEGISYITVQGAYWNDCYKENLNNICIKAFTTGVDKTELLSVIEKAELLNKEDYTAASWEPFGNQLEYARSLYEDENACSADIKNCIIRLDRLSEVLESSYFDIYSIEDFIQFSDKVNSGDSFEGITVRLNDDLDMTDIESFVPIGTIDNPFKGCFDGQDHIISNMTINSSDSPCGLFGYLDENGCIKNINLENATLSGSSDIGGICVYNNGVIDNCSFSGTLTAADENQGYIGMISAVSQGDILNCTASGDITAYSGYAGAIAGHIQSGNISDCQSSAKIQSQSGIVGGIVGRADSAQITDCSYSGDITGAVNAGGIAGNCTSVTITRCSTSGSITAKEAAGGIAGVGNAVEITDCAFTGSVTSEVQSGGIVGSISSGSINNSYNTGVVTAPIAGGIALSDALQSGEDDNTEPDDPETGDGNTGSEGDGSQSGDDSETEDGSQDGSESDDSESGDGSDDENNNGSESGGDNTESDDNTETGDDTGSDDENTDSEDDNDSGDENSGSENNGGSQDDPESDNDDSEQGSEDLTPDTENTDSENVSQSETDGTEPTDKQISINNCYSAAELQGETCYPIASEDAVLQNCYYVSDEQLEGAMTSEQMKTRRFAYDLNQDVEDSWLQWTQNSEQNGGYPTFAEGDNAVTVKPCIVTMDAGHDSELQILTDIDAGTVIELPQLESMTDEVFIGWSDSTGIFTNEYTVTDDVVITAVFKKPVSIEIKDAPQQVPLGQEINLEGSIIAVTFEDETVNEYPAVLATAELEAFTMGEHTVTLNFYGATCQFNIMVVAPESETIISIGAAEAQAGETVEIPITLSGCPSINSMTLYVDYDINAFSLIEVNSEIGDILSWETAEDKQIIHIKSDEPIDPNGVLAILKFKVLDDTEIGEYPITVNYDMREMLDESGQMFAPGLQNGQVNVIIKAALGDINDDGDVDLLDGVILSRYLDEAFDGVIVNETAADLDLSGTIDEKDLELLRELLIK